MPAMTRCPSCSHYWDAGDQAAHVLPPATADVAYAARMQSVLSGPAPVGWLQELLSSLLPVVEPLVEKWVRDLLGRIK